MYNNSQYRKSVFCKGPLLSASRSINENLPPESYIRLKAYKNNVKLKLLILQSSGEAGEWQNCNVPLYNIEGLHKSKVTYRKNVDYRDY